VLLAWLRGKRLDKPSGTDRGQHADCATVDDFERWAKKFKAETDWELNEWYEKLSTLHDRIAKRINRAQKSGVMNEGPSAPIDKREEQVSVLAHRKPWSV